MRIRKSELKKLVESVVRQVRESLEPPADQNMYMSWMDQWTDGYYRNVYTVDELVELAGQQARSRSSLWRYLKDAGRFHNVGKLPEFRGWLFGSREAAEYFTAKTGIEVDPREVRDDLDPEDWTYAWWDDPEFKSYSDSED